MDEGHHVAGALVARLAWAGSVRRVLLIALALLLPSACESLHGEDFCKTVGLGDPIASWATMPYPNFATFAQRIGAIAGPVLDIHCCHETNPQCPGVDCTQPLITMGEAFVVSAATIQWDDGVSLCGVWSFEGKVRAVWWEDDF
jgi:hypothetical protein